MYPIRLRGTLYTKNQTGRRRNLARQGNKTFAIFKQKTTHLQIEQKQIDKNVY